MRPINLIPVEERRDGSAQLRGGPLAYVLVGALVALLLGVVLLVNADNQIDQRKSEITQVQRETAAAQAKAARLASYIALSEVHARRTQTIESLADSRFDWERVIRELSLILPDDVLLTNLSGTAKPDVAVNGASGLALRSSVPGPALELLGCAEGQEGVAGFIADMKDIDGVTRVAIQSSKLGSGEGGGEDEAGSSGACPAPFDTQFEMVAAFDAAPESTVEGGE
jgi:Tfp pilus assembly protein PilN